VIYIAAYLEPLRGGKTAVEIYVRGKDAEANAKQFQECVELIKGAGVRCDPSMSFGELG
jgi:flagellar biosynthesis/type III secretory pathway protein FliH